MIISYRFSLILCVTILNVVCGKDDFFLGGIQVNEPDHERWVSSLNHHGMNTVSITVYANHGVWNKSELRYQDEDLGVSAELKVAKDHGLKVVFIPRVALDHRYPENKHLWHGMIMPKTDEELRTWFKTYQKYLLKWAKVAEREEVEVFAVGSELKALIHTQYLGVRETVEEVVAYNNWYKDYPEKVMKASGERELISQHYQDVVELSEAYLKWGVEVFAQHESVNHFNSIKQRRELLSELWEETILMVREVFSGKLTYAANFDNYHNVGVWQHLDIMGINAYFQLRKDMSPLPEEELQKVLDLSWSDIFTGIRRFKEENEVTDMSLIFTELGYTYKNHSSVEPWSYVGKSIVEHNEIPNIVEWEKQPKNYQERYQCLKAMQKAVAHNDFFMGLLYWKFSTDIKHEEIEAFVIDVSPESKDPALKVLTNLFNPSR